ncbi:putative repeat protein (TIGR01451 family) [Variovorax sp. 54]|nr:putative repeat protein (TIGR01451 family) [Variovorax sp. 54]
MVRAGLGLLAAGGMAVALAQPATSVEAPRAPATAKAVTVVLTQSKVVKGPDGNEQLQDAATIKPGDVIEYKATYTNNTSKSVKGLVADLPIPEGLEYLPRSAKPGASLVKAATKDAVFEPEPLVRKLAGGKTEPVPYSEYRMLRWSLGQLPANGSTAVSARAKVEAVAPPPAPLASAAPPPRGK